MDIANTIAATVGLLSLQTWRSSSKQLDKELSVVSEERKEIRQRLLEKTNENIIDTIQLGLNQLTEYYELVPLL